MFFEGFPSPNGATDVQVFNQAASVDFLQTGEWRKPAGCTMAWILCMGAGGGGGGGFTRAAAAAGGGGGGGGSGGHANLLIPLIYLPDQLCIQVGAGGQGVGSGGGTAGSAIGTRITLRPAIAQVQTNTLIASNSTAQATGGGTGTGAAVGAAGAAGGVMVLSSAPLIQFGMWSSVAGMAGGAGGAVAGGTGAGSTIPATGQRNMGGAGGSGTTSGFFAGAGVSTITDSFLWLSAPRDPIVTGTGVAANPGSSGYMLWKPFFSYCGLGGGSSNDAVGGAGGNAAYGSGGGGGGAGTTGGRGGNGGGGLVIIVSW